MRKKANKWMVMCIMGALMASQISGCSQKTEVPTKESTPQTVNQMEAAVNNSGEGFSVTAKLGEDGEKTITYLAEDLDSTWEEATSTGIVGNGSEITVVGDGAVISGQTVSITKGGTYVVSGTLSDGQILIDVGKEEVVQLVLNGAEISNQTTAPIDSIGKGKVILTLAAGTVNTISDSSEYLFASAAEEEPNAPVFANGNLTINGSGTLNVDGNFECAIRSKSVLTVVSGELSLTAATDGLKGKDAVIIRDAEITITSGKDGIKSNNDEDPEQGYIWIDGGHIQIAAQDDGIQAETALIVNGGEINITESMEGLAGKTVDINGGLIKAVTSDDGINSAATVATEQEKMQDQEGVYTRIAGGEIWLNTQSDGIDSNGDLYMEGGTVYLSGPVSDGDGILDYNGKGYLTGGTFFGAGSSGMMQTFAEDSTQNYLVVYYTTAQKAGTRITLTDSSGKEVGSYTPEKDFSAVIISSAGIQTGNTYQVTTGEETLDLTVEGLMTTSGTPADRGGRIGRFGDGQRPDMGERPTNEAGEPVDGQFPGRGMGGGRGAGVKTGGEMPTDHPPELPAETTAAIQP